MENGADAQAAAASEVKKEGVSQEGSQEGDQDEDDRSTSAPPVLELTAKVAALCCTFGSRSDSYTCCSAFSPSRFPHV
eukprot:3762162-Rhodomonas_salina.3